MKLVCTRSGGRTEPGDLHNLSTAHVGRVIGTPLYMAPEQAAARLEEVDQQTDVYGLGGILYSILTGVGPHHADASATYPGEGRAEFLTRVLREEVTEPVKRLGDVAPELNAICMKALSARKHRRYTSASELADDVQRYMAGSPVRAYEAPLGRRLSRWMNRHCNNLSNSLGRKSKKKLYHSRGLQP